MASSHPVQSIRFAGLHRLQQLVRGCVFGRGQIGWRGNLSAMRMGADLPFLLHSTVFVNESHRLLAFRLKDTNEYAFHSRMNADECFLCEGHGAQRTEDATNESKLEG